MTDADASKLGWICPLCSLVHSPTTEACRCLVDLEPSKAVADKQRLPDLPAARIVEFSTALDADPSCGVKPGPWPTKARRWRETWLAVAIGQRPELRDEAWQKVFLESGLTWEEWSTGKTPLDIERERLVNVRDRAELELQWFDQRHPQDAQAVGEEPDVE